MTINVEKQKKNIICAEFWFDWYFFFQYCFYLKISIGHLLYRGGTRRTWSCCFLFLYIDHACICIYQIVERRFSFILSSSVFLLPICFVLFRSVSAFSGVNFLTKRKYKLERVTTTTTWKLQISSSCCLSLIERFVFLTGTKNYFKGHRWSDVNWVGSFFYERNAKYLWRMSIDLSKRSVMFE